MYVVYHFRLYPDITRIKYVSVPLSAVHCILLKKLHLDQVPTKKINMIINRNLNFKKKKLWIGKK